MDDGLISVPTESKAIDLLQRTEGCLAQSYLKLHKIASNSAAVMEAFPAEDLAKGIKDLSLTDEALPTQRSLGLHWEEHYCGNSPWTIVTGTPHSQWKS